MSYENYAQPGAEYYPAAMAAAEERKAFIQKTYLHVGGALAAFGVLLALAVSMIPPKQVFTVLSSIPLGWLGVMLLFIGGTWIGARLAQPQMSVGVQYLGLALFVVLEVLIFLPLLSLVAVKTGSFELVIQAAILTLAVAGGLIAAALTTGKDFSFLGPIVWIGSLVALGVIAVAVIFGFTLGTFFAIACIALMCASILYQTSQVMYHYPTNAYVAAALSIFSAIVTMFYYIIILFLDRR